jgi:Cu/Ag efflux protein CusF
MMKERIVAILGALSLLAVAGCASTPDKAPANEKAVTQPAEQVVAVRDKVTATGTVKAINLDTREVTLQGKKGKPFTITVSDAVTNLPQVKVGDRVVITYYEALMVQLPGKTGDGITRRTDTLGVSSAQPGQMPSGAVRDTVRVTANILSVNPKTRKVILQGPKRAMTVIVPKDMDISKFNAGDQIQAEFLQEVAISVERAPAPTKSSAGRNNKKS